MQNEELKKLAEKQVSILDYSDDLKIAAINGFMLGFNYLGVTVSDILNSPRFADVLATTFKNVNAQTVDAFKKEFTKQTKLSPKVVDTYSEFIAIFFKQCFESGNEVAIKLIKQIITLE